MRIAPILAVTASLILGTGCAGPRGGPYWPDTFDENDLEGNPKSRKERIIEKVVDIFIDEALSGK